MANNFLGEIRITGFNFAPIGWALCNGQILPISQNTALFSLLGTYYGGDGRSTFALPNLQGTAPLHQGGNYVIGETGGEESVTLITGQLPAHNHASVQAVAGNARGDKHSPTGDEPAGHSSANVYAAAANAQMAALPASGQLQAHENRQPFLTMNFIIAVTGIFPSRS